MKKLNLRIIKDEAELERLSQEPEKHIPHGWYCYTGIGWEGNAYHIDCCPFWNKSLDHAVEDCGAERYNGYCHFLKSGDWEDGSFGDLWDQCKECGINVSDV
jgi:hypothetical protein